MMRLAWIILIGLGVVWGQGRRVDPPALAESGMAFLTTGPDGRVYLSWIDPENGGHALRYARWEGTQWGKPETIAAGKNWFVNWADFPSLAVGADGSMLAHWLTRAEGGGKFGYGIRVARRAPGGGWREIHGMSLKETEDYAGFLSFGAGGALYLAPPAEGASGGSAHAGHDDHGHRKTLRFLRLRADGSVESDNELDSDVCSCCQTSVVETGRGLLGAYRDHREGEIRDISVVRFVDGAWTAPKTLHPDGWKINGCPTEGPSVAAGGDGRAGIAWLTRANGVAKIQMALSKDGGATFAAPVRIDSGNPLGRPMLTPWGPGEYLAVWLEKAEGTAADVRMRRVRADGRMGAAMTVARSAASRTTGFPKAVVSGNQVIVAWRNGSVRAVVLHKNEILSGENK